jgi:predicted ester cyclase
VALIDEIVAGDYVGHTPPNDIHGPKGAKQFEVIRHKAIPDMQVTVEDQVAEADKVATR